MGYETCEGGGTLVRQTQSRIEAGGNDRPLRRTAKGYARFLSWGVVCLVLHLGLIYTQLETAIAGPIPASTPSQALSIGLTVEGDVTSFDLLLSEGVPAEIFTLSNPYRVIIDLPNLSFKLPPSSGKQTQGLVSAFRYGLFAEGKARVVIDTSGPVKIKSAAMTRSDKGVLLKLALAATDAASFGLGTGATRQASPQADNKDGGATPKQPALRARPVVVIDAGHGGIDPGATSPASVLEKNLVLAVALQLKAVLVQTGRFDIRMTRTSDVFVSLDRRLKFSADNDADLFISLHADSIEERDIAENIRGATIYTLSEKASDNEARRMAEKENASDLIAGLESGSGAAHDQVKNILIDLLKRETSNFSADFSNVVALKLGKSIAMAKDPQRSAAFKVLKQTHAPSVLIELGYMSNSKDQEQMSNAAWQKQVAVSIAAAVQTYFGKRTVEHP
jgi:N-acetylmuramoyl-L-alanine amidase